MTLCFHPEAKISDKADIEDSTRGTKIIVGANSVIDSFVKVKPAGGSGDVEIGEHCQINSGCVIYTGNGVKLGNGVLVAANTVFAATNHAFTSREIPIFKQGHMPSKGGIVIDDDVWVGANCTILDGTKIGKGAIIAAGAVVRGELDAYGIYAGNPAVKIKDRPE